MSKKTPHSRSSADRTAAAANVEEVGFEQAVAELERIIDAIESGEIDLERSLLEYERGVALVRRCRKILDNAELKVKELSLETGLAVEIPAQPRPSPRGADKPPHAGLADEEEAPF